MIVSLIQMNSGENKKDNFSKSIRLLNQSLKDNPDIICLSELFLYCGDKEIEYAEKLNSDIIACFKEFAKNNNVNIVLGSIALKVEDKITNTSLVIDRNGDIVHKYDKIYMYDVEKEDIVFKESDVTVAGNKIGLFELDGIKMGVGICIDLRFPEYFRELVVNGTEIIFLPASFRKRTGSLAWSVLTQSRAIENQVYFCACNQTSGMGAKERCGNSRIISYDGKILKNIEYEEGVISSNLDLNYLEKYRKEFPVLKQIRK
ncbi:MAG: hypothetical protein KAI55_03855 [Candidatus Aenigmarchaeota archaeon]|nr:hypothetical protein [Candidatus Aenigmarchaeota archaeon]